MRSINEINAAFRDPKYLTSLEDLLDIWFQLIDSANSLELSPCQQRKLDKHIERLACVIAEAKISSIDRESSLPPRVPRKYLERVVRELIQLNPN